MKKTLQTTLIQLNSGADTSSNQENALALLEKALNQSPKPDLILFPEVTNFRGPKTKVIPNAESIPGPFLAPFMTKAKESNTTIIVGSIIESSPIPDKVFNTSVVISPEGDIQATYRKLHMFDANIGKAAIRESAMYEPGSSPTLTTINGQKVGLTICFDLRFPALYQQYAAQGATIMTVPSSFTTPTGQAHWEVLLRARAIENQCFILAPNQVGIGAGNVPTYGNSMIIDPWGTILARASETQEEIISATLDLETLENVRTKLPSLSLRRDIPPIM